MASWLLYDDDEFGFNSRRSFNRQPGTFGQTVGFGEPRRSRRRVFVSFDFDNDDELKHALIGQSRYPNSPFDVYDWSLKEAAPERNWKQKARQRISAAEIVIVICGQYTHRAPGVAAELAMAHELGKPYFFLKGRPDRYCYAPSNAGPNEKIYTWTWDNLEKLIAGMR